MFHAAATTILVVQGNSLRENYGKFSPTTCIVHTVGHSEVISGGGLAQTAACLFETKKRGYRRSSTPQSERYWFTF